MTPEERVEAVKAGRMAEKQKRTCRRCLRCFRHYKKDDDWQCVFRGKTNPNMTACELFKRNENWHEQSLR